MKRYPRYRKRKYFINDSGYRIPRYDKQPIDNEKQFYSLSHLGRPAQDPWEQNVDYIPPEWRPTERVVRTETLEYTVPKKDYLDVLADDRRKRTEQMREKEKVKEKREKVKIDQIPNKYNPFGVDSRKVRFTVDDKAKLNEMYSKMNTLETKAQWLRTDMQFMNMSPSRILFMMGDNGLEPITVDNLLREVNGHVKTLENDLEKMRSDKKEHHRIKEVQRQLDIEKKRAKELELERRYFLTDAKFQTEELIHLTPQLVYNITERRVGQLFDRIKDLTESVARSNLVYEQSNEDLLKKYAELRDDYYGLKDEYRNSVNEFESSKEDIEQLIETDKEIVQRLKKYQLEDDEEHVAKFNKRLEELDHLLNLKNVDDRFEEVNRLLVQVINSHENLNMRLGEGEKYIEMLKKNLPEYQWSDKEAAMLKQFLNLNFDTPDGYKNVVQNITDLNDIVRKMRDEGSGIYSKQLIEDFIEEKMKNVQQITREEYDEMVKELHNLADMSRRPYRFSDHIRFSHGIEERRKALYVSTVRNNIAMRDKYIKNLEEQIKTMNAMVSNRLDSNSRELAKKIDAMNAEIALQKTTINELKSSIQNTLTGVEERSKLDDAFKQQVSGQLVKLNQYDTLFNKEHGILTYLNAKMPGLMDGFENYMARRGTIGTTYPLANLVNAINFVNLLRRETNLTNVTNHEEFINSFKQFVGTLENMGILFGNAQERQKLKDFDVEAIRNQIRNEFADQLNTKLNKSEYIRGINELSGKINALLTQKDGTDIAVEDNRKSLESMKSTLDHMGLYMKKMTLYHSEFNDSFNSFMTSMVDFAGKLNEDRINVEELKQSFDMLKDTYKTAKSAGSDIYRLISEKVDEALKENFNALFDQRVMEAFNIIRNSTFTPKRKSHVKVTELSDDVRKAFDDLDERKHAQVEMFEPIPLTGNSFSAAVVMPRGVHDSTIKVANPRKVELFKNVKVPKGREIETTFPFDFIGRSKGKKIKDGYSIQKKRIPRVEAQKVRDEFNRVRARELKQIQEKQAVVTSISVDGANYDPSQSQPIEKKKKRKTQS